MTHRKVEFHPQASEEYLAAFEWYFPKNELVAVRFAGEVRRAIELIAKAPDRWPSTQEAFGSLYCAVTLS
jgi:plasmid stabilization system protein ParE